MTALSMLNVRAPSLGRIFVLRRLRTLQVRILVVMMTSVVLAYAKNAFRPSCSVFPQTRQFSVIVAVTLSRVFNNGAALEFADCIVVYRNRVALTFLWVMVRNVMIISVFILVLVVPLTPERNLFPRRWVPAVT